MHISERSQSEKATYCMIPTIWHSGKGKTMETIKKKSVVGRGWVEEEWINGSQRIFRTLKILCMTP